LCTHNHCHPFYFCVLGRNILFLVKRLIRSIHHCDHCACLTCIIRDIFNVSICFLFIFFLVLFNFLQCVLLCFRLLDFLNLLSRVLHSIHFLLLLLLILHLNVGFLLTAWLWLLHRHLCIIVCSFLFSLSCYLMQFHLLIKLSYLSFLCLLKNSPFIISFLFEKFPRGLVGFHFLNFCFFSILCIEFLKQALYLFKYFFGFHYLLKKEIVFT